MDREFILKASQDYYINHNNKSNVIIDILKEYCCVEHNKDKNNTEIFIRMVLSNFPIFYKTFEHALNYYENKFNIIKIEKENRIIKIY